MNYDIVGENIAVDVTRRQFSCLCCRLASSSELQCDQNGLYDALPCMTDIAFAMISGRSSKFVMTASKELIDLECRICVVVEVGRTKRQRWYRCRRITSGYSELLR
jgi:hypothetical protein